MKQLFIIVGLVLASASAASRFDDDLREFVEYIKQQMPCGFPSFGVPPLAPYTLDFKTFNLVNHGIDLNGNLTNLSVDGLNNFDIQELTYSTILLSLKFDFNFNQIKVFSQYVAKGGLQVLGLPMPLNGIGDLDLAVENLRFNGSLRLRPTTSNGLEIWAFNCNLELNKIQSKVTGINNSPALTNIFNAVVEEFVRIIFQDYQIEINNRIAGYIVPNANHLLSGVSIVDLMTLVFGLGPNSANLPVCNL